MNWPALQMQKDIGFLLSTIDQMSAAYGDDLDIEDKTIVGQIQRDYEKRKARLASNTKT